MEIIFVGIRLCDRLKHPSSRCAEKLLDACGLGPGVVLAHVSTELQGDSRAPGQVRSTLMTLVIDRRGTHWKIIAAQNTNIVASPA